jgi:hypothetical protein
VFGLVFSLELTPVFNNRTNVTLIANIGCCCLRIIISIIKWGLFDKAGVCLINASMVVV